MEKLRITKTDYDELQLKCPPVTKGFVIDEMRFATNVEYFSYYGLGLKPRTWQTKLWKKLKTKDKVMACTGRQVGKTVAGAVYVLQQCLYNLRPVGVGKKTLWIVISATEEQSKEVIVKMRDILRIGDDHISKLTNGKVKEYYTSRISKVQGDRNDSSTLTFDNGCKIMSFPPTDRSRGYSPSGVWEDEFAFFENQELHNKVVKPMLQDTKGQNLVTTTPNGQQGEFFTLFDPFEERVDHEYDRLWLDFQCMEFDDPERVKIMIQEQKFAYETGNQRQFDQESLAMFTAQTGSFFDPKKVDECLDKGTEIVHTYKGHCDLGIDFGKVVSRTVVSIVRLDDDGKTIRLLYQFEYPPTQDLSLEDDIDNLLREFNVQRIVYEDCPQSEHFRQVAMIKTNWNPVAFVPQAEKLKKYNTFKKKVLTGHFKCYDERELFHQMKGLQYEETPRTTKIYAGAGLRDDRIDSVVIASKFMLEDTGGFKFYSWDDV